MAEFVVNTDQLRSNADRIAALQRELDSVAVRLGAIQLGSVLQIRASTALIARVGDCKWAAAHQSDDLGRLARGLDDIALLYDNTEKNLADPKTQAEAQAQEHGGDSAAADEESWWHEVMEWIDGLPIPIIDAIGAELGEFIPGIAGNICDWALSLFQNVIGNYLEFEDWTPQMIYEIIGETGIDIAMSGLAGLAIGAICVAVGVTPVGWAVAAGGVAVTWLADTICEWLADGRDISEVIVDWFWENTGVQDFVNDVAETIDNAVDAVDNFIDETAEAVNDAIDAAGEFVDDAIDAAGEFVDDAIEAADEFVDDAIDTIRDGAVAAWDTATDVVAELWPF